tara:strand:- start:837 stop:1229 length:393 start_codon:yes stop_codon:yes gene_type:complete
MIGFKDFLSVVSETSPLNGEESLALSEVLSFQARRKKSIEMRRRKQRLQRQRKIALRRPATLDRLKKRGRRTARDMLTKRYYGGKTKKDMSISQKARVEKRLNKFKRVAGIISKRLLPSKRKLDVQRRRG